MAAVPARPQRTNAAAARRAHPRHATVHRQTTPTSITLPTILAHGLNLLPPLFAAPLAKLSHGDPVLMLLGALALAVLVLASLTMLKLLSRAGREGWEEPGL